MYLKEEDSTKKRKEAASVVQVYSRFVWQIDKGKK